jgi:ABC-type multidrug transport system ATPase subunit
MSHPFDLDQVVLENVTLAQPGLDPVLQSVDFDLPTDQTIVIESSNPNSSLQFLQFLSGARPCVSGRILWNGQDIFSDEHEVDPRAVLGVYFEGAKAPVSMTLKAYLQQFLNAEDLQATCEQLDLTPYLINDLSKLSYALQKLVFMAQTVCKNPQMLLLEDPASGLSESQWLNFLDLVQYKQRQGHLRHIFLTNHHPTAMNHLAHNKLFLEEGIIYFDESAPSKKVAHF